MSVMSAMTLDQLRDMLLFTADRIIENKPYLTEVDSKIGDGDHGIGMEIGFQKAKETLSGKEFSSAPEMFRAVGMAMLNSMGGASGVIFGTLFFGGAKGADPQAPITPEFLAAFFAKSLAAIKARGGAQVGDKTMVDALEPACLALEESAKNGAGFPQALEKAAEAARTGMESTKQMVAKFGRAKSLMERAVGFQDAGATSVYLIFQAMEDWARENCGG